MLQKPTVFHKIAIQTFLIIMAVLWLYPTVQSVIQSLKIKGFGNYISVIINPDVSYFRVLFNSLIISVCTTVTVVILASLAGYAISKMEFKLKNLIYYSLIACLSIPSIAVMSPIFFTVKKLGLMDTYASIILPLVAFLAPFILMLIKNFFDTIPDAILESALIDGSSSFRTFIMIILPLGKPVITNSIVLTFMNSWNEFLMPLLFARKTEMYTVTLATQYYMSAQNQTPQMIAQFYAALILLIIPSITIYLLGQRYLHAGLTAGAVKE